MRAGQKDEPLLHSTGLARETRQPPRAASVTPNGATSHAVAAAIDLRRGREVRSLWAETWRRFRRHRLAIFGATVVTVLVAAVLLGPLVYHVPINEIDFKAKLKGPSWAHPLGTDDLGQDVLARMLYGGRISLAVGVAAMLIAISVGTAVGAVGT